MLCRCVTTWCMLLQTCQIEGQCCIILVIAVLHGFHESGPMAMACRAPSAQKCGEQCYIQTNKAPFSDG